MQRSLAAVAGLFTVFLIVACGSKGSPSSPPPATADASHDASGATADATAPSDAAADAIPFDGGDQCFPPCLAMLLSSCAPSGACTQSGSTDCYPNGVEIVVALTGMNRSQLTYSKQGALCFTETYVGMGGTATTPVTSAVTTYSDPSGMVVATEDDDFSGTVPSSTVTCGGVAYRIDPESQACSGGDAGAACTPGTCM